MKNFKAIGTVEEKVIYNRISETITEKIQLNEKRSVFDKDGNEYNSYLSKTSTYIVKNKLVNISQVVYDLGQAKEMDFRLNMLRVDLKKSDKCYALGWDNHEPAFILVTSGIDRVYAYWFDEKYDNRLMSETFRHFGYAIEYLRNMYGKTSVERWLTFNSRHSTNKKVLTVTDWLYRR